jgi:chromosome partitioning protein
MAHFVGYFKILSRQRPLPEKVVPVGWCELADGLTFGINEYQTFDDRVDRHSITGVRMRVAQIVAITQDKRGVGETSIASNVGALAALVEYRTLIVDLDPYGLLARDLGMELNDGQGLFTALASGTHLPAEPNVRAQLDVVPGGSRMAALGELLSPRTLTAALRSSLERLSPDYDLILVNTPADVEAVAIAAMSVSNAVLIPTRVDDGSVDRLDRLSKTFNAARRNNPDLRLAGILLSVLGSRSRGLELSVRASIEEMGFDSNAIFDTCVRHMMNAAVDVRRSGLLAYELKDALQLARDYQGVTCELLVRLSILERQALSDSSPGVLIPRADPIARLPVSSSNIVSVGYSGAAFILEVEFVNGRVYQYLDVPLAHYVGIMRAESPGRYLNEYVKPTYDYVELDGN